MHVWDMRCAKGVAAGMAGPTVALRPVLSLKVPPWFFRNT